MGYKTKTVKNIENEMDCILVNACNVWHTSDSMELLGVAGDLGSGLRMITEHIALNKQKELSDELLEQLVEMGQTQGYKGPGEFYLNVVPLNSLL